MYLILVLVILLLVYDLTDQYYNLSLNMQWTIVCFVLFIHILAYMESFSLIKYAYMISIKALNKTLKPHRGRMTRIY